ncbi:ABCB family ABC transporter ATP-binding protein/permease [Oecophyllibacter saccharovorans]|uniref:ABC transporter ATP-binding protein/permease n=1 Tax=Oecophyllibacter saccharovorans TaxID=2558360 RepID=A0A506UQZ7_9PROT|nr:ATP-binding cassette domain-containing protein [Oecophyllibacter saccharovorans]TPW35776.1 ABC transporter ATP-binding protein/permease [Oecophyllibacter saccharovorans]
MLPLRTFWQRLRPVPFWPVGLRLGCAIGLLFMESGTSVATPWLFSRLVAVLAPAAGTPVLVGALTALMAQYAVIRLISGITGPVREILVSPVKAQFKKRVALLGLAQIHRLGARFHLGRQTGALTRVLDRGAEAVGTILDLALSSVLPNLLTLVLTFGIILKVFSGFYLLVLLLTVALYGGVSYFFTRWRMDARRERNRLSGEVHHHLVDSLLNAETVRAFDNASHELQGHEKRRQALLKAEIRLQYLVSGSQLCRNVLIALSTTALLGLAAWDILAGRIGVAQFVLIGTYLRSIYASVGMLNYVGAGWRNARVDIENYLELLALQPEILSPAEPAHLPVSLAQPPKEATNPETRGVGVVFSHVTFGYEAGRPILHDISFTIAPGETLAVVGRTGSGKSTLARLLTRAYDPQEGRVSVAGYDLPHIALEDLRRLIGVVPQDCALFNASIGDNIAYGRIGATPEEVREAAYRAQIGAFIDSLPQGFETMVGERGLKLSGGERQRVAIARVILRNPSLLVLDEASSALDTRTEAAIQKELAALSRQRTTLVVAHRLSTVQDAHRILVLDQGRIVEEGDHASLLARGGVYAEMWAAQQAGEG